MTFDDDAWIVTDKLFQSCSIGGFNRCCASFPVLTCSMYRVVKEAIRVQSLFQHAKVKYDSKDKPAAAAKAVAPVVAPEGVKMEREDKA